MRCMCSDEPQPELSAILSATYSSDKQHACRGLIQQDSLANYALER
jgi:hypothetical protein